MRRIIPSLAVPVLACGGDDSRVHLYVQLSGQVRLRDLYFILMLSNLFSFFFPCHGGV